MVKQFRSMTYPYVAWISVMIVLPMLLIVLYAFTVSGNEVLTFQFTFDNFKRFVTDTVFMEVLGRSLYIAVLTTLICIALGYPIAYAIAQMNLCVDGHFAGRGYPQHHSRLFRHWAGLDDPHELRRHSRHGV